MKLHRTNRSAASRLLKQNTAVAMLAGLGATRAPAADPATDENVHLWKPRITSVAVFKNGLGFFLRSGAATLRDGWCLAGEVPPAHFGTLAVYSHGRDDAPSLADAGEVEAGHGAAAAL